MQTDYKRLSIVLGVAFLGASIIAFQAITAFNELSNY